MKPLEVKRVLEIVEDALPLSGGELTEYLDRVCGTDSPLRREVLDYLQFDSNHSIFHGLSDDSAPSISLPSTSGSRYELQEEIARGGMGVIVRAFDTELRREVAVKFLHDSLRDEPGLVRRFVQEAQLGGQLQHPGIAPVYDIGRLPDGRSFIAMKLVKGKTLELLLHERQDLRNDLTKYLGIFEQLCQAMAFAHSHGVIHRDLKPANVMIGEFGEVQVMDWGLARLLNHEQQTPDELDGADESSSDSLASRVTVGVESSQTRIGQVMGTPAYMSPEQILGRTDKTTDVFALGAMLCEFLTGLPGVGDLDAALARLDDCAFDAEIVAIVRTCIAKDPGARPRDAEVLAVQISAYLEATQSRLEAARIAAARAQVTADEERKRRRVSVALAVCCSLAVVIAIGSWAWISNQRLIHERELDHQRIRSQSEADIALLEADRLYEIAKAAPLLDLDDWRIAREAVTRAQSLVKTGSLGPEMTERVSSLSDRIMLGETEHELFWAIDVARERGIETSKYSFQDTPSRSLPPLIKVMSENGLHPETCKDWIVASRQIKTYSEVIGDEVIGALDQLLVVAEGADRSWFLNVLQDADPNPWRKAWRKAFAEEDEDELRMMFLEDGIALQTSRSALNVAYSVRGLTRDEERLTVLQRLRARHVNDVWINLRIAKILWKLKRKVDASVYYESAISARPSATMHAVVAAVAMERKDYPVAVSHWREAIRLNPSETEYYIYLGQNLGQVGRKLEAIEVFRQVVKRRPEHLYSVSILGVLLTRAGKPKDAIPYLERALALDPDHSISHLLYAKALYLCGRYQAAAQALESALACTDDPEFDFMFKEMAAEAEEYAPCLFAAANGEGIDAVDMAEEDRVRLRTLALSLLREHFDRFGSSLPQSTYPESFAKLRSKETQGRLSDPERAQWEKFWQEYDAIPGIHARLVGAKADWTVVTSASISSQFQSEFTIDADGSVFAGGNNEPFDVYTIVASPTTGLLTAMRLEVLDDSRLPGRGPGRHSSGNFALGEVVLEVRHEGAETAQGVKIDQAWASYAWKSRPVGRLIDGDSKTAWHVWDGFGKSHTAVFLLDEPVVVAPGTSLTIRLQHGGDTGAGIGKFRLSLTSDKPRGK